MLVVLTAHLGGCGGEGSRPFSAPSPTLTAGGLLIIDGPTQIPPSATGTFKAWLSRPGQPPEDVSARVQWRSTNHAVATVAPGGAVSTGAIGEAVIEALLDAQQIGRMVRVVPDGTFALTGKVWPFGPQFRARVEVSGGIGPPASTEVSDLGAFRLLGVGGRVRVTVRMDGFASHTAEVDVSADTQHEAVMALDGSARPWRLSVTPASNCTDFASRTYSSDVLVVLREPTALLSPVEQPALTFSGTLRADVLTLLLAESHDIWDYYPPGPRLRSSSGGVVEVLGTAQTTWDGSRYAGLVEGYVAAVPSAGSGYCYAPNHRVTLQKVE